METAHAPYGEEDEPLLPARRPAHGLDGAAHQRDSPRRHWRCVDLRESGAAVGVGYQGEERSGVRSLPNTRRRTRETRLDVPSLCLIIAEPTDASWPAIFRSSPPRRK